MKGSELTKPTIHVDTIRGKGLRASIHTVPFDPKGKAPSPKTRIGRVTLTFLLIKTKYKRRVDYLPVVTTPTVA